MRSATERKLTLAEPTDFRALVGHGVEAKVEGRAVVIGKASLLRERGVNLTLESKAAELAALGRTALYVAIDGREGALLAVADRARPESKAAVDQMHALGLLGS